MYEQLLVPGLLLLAALVAALLVFIFARRQTFRLKASGWFTLGLLEHCRAGEVLADTGPLPLGWYEAKVLAYAGQKARLKLERHRTRQDPLRRAPQSQVLVLSAGQSVLWPIGRIGLESGERLRLVAVDAISEEVQGSILL